MITVILLNEHDIQSVPPQKEFQAWMDLIIKTIPEKIPKNTDEICISIVDTKVSAQLNDTFRGKKGPTNVLSFPSENMPGIIQNSLGDLAICAEVIEEEAKEQDKSSVAHWAHITLHGILHLLGYDHIDESDAIVMETLEIKLLNELGYENPY